MAPRARLFLVDGSSQMYRAYHAIRGLTGPDGHSTNAVYGFTTMLRKLVADHAPAYIAAAFDLQGPTFRSELAADYKANRRPMPPDLAEQVPLVHEACEALGVPVLTYSGFEADDVIGTLAARATAAGFDVAIVTGDKDFFQLVGGAIRVFNPRDEGTWFDAEGVAARFGVAPSQVVDVLALMGDSIDNVKGVPGIGEKGAKDLIARFGSLDALLDAAPGLEQKKYREALTAHADSARHSREMVTIRTDVPIDVDLESLRYRGASRERCFALFTKLGFRTLTTEYAPSAATTTRDYATITTRAALEAFAANVRAAGSVAVHAIFDGPPLSADIVGFALSLEGGHARYVPVPSADEPGTHGGTLFDDVGPADSAPGEQLARADVLEIVGGLLADRAMAKRGHDMKTLAVALAHAGITLDGVADDAVLASYVLDATQSGHAIETLALEHLVYRASSEDDVRGRGAKALAWRALDAARTAEFACERADLAGQLAARLSADVDAQQLTAVYRDMELPLVPVLVAIERAGVRVDAAALGALSSLLERDLAERTARIYAMAGMEFNVNSPKQLSEVLFEKLALPVTKKTGRTRTASTAVEVLEELALVHDLPREILEWRALQKLKGTYVDALPALVNPATGRVHTTFNQAVAATGRLSSSEPNLQNIPIRTELGREIRRAFVAEPGFVLVSADYSQIELRVLAHLSGDATLIEAFRRREDIHDRTAARVFGAESGLDPYELRRRAKIINYALLYGKTAFTLARDIGVTQQAAQEFIDAYFAGFPGVRAFIDTTLAEARARGVVATMFGRRRLVPDITNRNGMVRAAAERIAVNMPIQGSAADILKRAMIALDRTLAGEAGPRRARMILTVHDELLFEVPEDEADRYAAIVGEGMEGAASLAVPLDVDVGIGRNWKEAKA